MTKEMSCRAKHAILTVALLTLGATVILAPAILLSKQISESGVTAAKAAAEAATKAAEAAAAATGESARVGLVYELRISKAEEALRAADTALDLRLRESEQFRAAMKVSIENTAKGLDRIEKKLDERLGTTGPRGP